MRAAAATMALEAERTLLDAKKIARSAAGLRGLDGRRICRAELEGLWVKPQRHFNAWYRFLDFAGVDVIVAGFALGAERTGRVASRFARHRCDDGGSARCPACSTRACEGGVLLQVFPFDYRLPTLGDCFDLDRVRRELSPQARVHAAQPVGYRPGMRCQIRYELDDGTSVFGKVAFEREPGQAFARFQAVHAALDRSARGIRVPPPWRYLSGLRLALVRGVGGKALWGVLRADKQAGGAMPAVAEGLAEFHALELGDVSRVYGPDDELLLLGGWIGLIASLFPELEPVLRAREAELARTKPAQIEPRALVHRDFYDKQIVLPPRGGVILLDLDTVCRGDPEIDLGNFAAHLQVRELEWNRPLWSETLEHAFLGAYPRPFAPERVAWYRSAALLRLACLSALRPQWRHLPRVILGEGMPV